MTNAPFRRLFLGLGLAAAVSVTAEINVGDSYAQVLREKGLPQSKIELGDTHVLHYQDRTIQLQDGKVVSVENASRPSVTVNLPNRLMRVASATAPAGRTDETAAVWQTDFNAALAQAKAENRHVFLFFTGSDWCSWCRRLNQEVLSTPDFARFAHEKLILVEVDFPQKRHQSAALKAQNAKLAKRFKIEGYPTVVILDGAGKKLDELGYQEGGPGPFVERLNKL